MDFKLLWTVFVILATTTFILWIEYKNKEDEEEE